MGLGRILMLWIGCFALAAFLFVLGNLARVAWVGALVFLVLMPLLLVTPVITTIVGSIVKRQRDHRGRQS